MKILEYYEETKTAINNTGFFSVEILVEEICENPKLAISIWDDEDNLYDVFPIGTSIEDSWNQCRENLRAQAKALIESATQQLVVLEFEKEEFKPYCVKFVVKAIEGTDQKQNLTSYVLFRNLQKAEDRSFIGTVGFSSLGVNLVESDIYQDMIDNAIKINLSPIIKIGCC